ncbi:hypothetical protein JEQ12_010626 [Ovis aries]|uniref:Uncharacterized protein n=1 Tax=Ovis aries TaxID=9940 RepID=A0A836CSA9_SHEEP|nr:hypothetical protein JEQ12_010626 [Ovis aries]
MVPARDHEQKELMKEKAALGTAQESSGSQLQTLEERPQWNLRGAKKDREELLEVKIEEEELGEEHKYATTQDQNLQKNNTHSREVFPQYFRQFCYQETSGPHIETGNEYRNLKQGVSQEMKPYGNIAGKFENEMSQPARYEKTYEPEGKTGESSEYSREDEEPTCDENGAPDCEHGLAKMLSGDAMHLKAKQESTAFQLQSMVTQLKCESFGLHKFEEQGCTMWIVEGLCSLTRDQTWTLSSESMES